MVRSSSLPSVPPHHIGNNQSTIQKTTLDNKIESATTDLQSQVLQVELAKVNRDISHLRDEVRQSVFIFHKVHIHNPCIYKMILLDCCGAYMLPDKELEKTIIYKCKECGLSDSRQNDID